MQEITTHVELKRRLNNSETVVSKRLCLAKNVIQSHHFPAASKERIVSEWLDDLAQKNALTSDDLRGIVGWLKNVDELTGELKSRLIQVVARYFKRNPTQTEDVLCIIEFLENSKISSQLCTQIEEYLSIVITLLQFLRNEESIPILLCERLFNNLIQNYKESKKKFELIVKLLEGENLETVFSFIDVCRNSVIHVCQNILFPITKVSFFISFLQTLLKNDNIDILIAEKGDNIQSVLKIMSAFFTFPNRRTSKDPKFLSHFIDMFVSCFKVKSQIIFAFYIMVANSLNMRQSYYSVTMNMPPIIFEENDEKVKRQLFYDMLEILHKNEIDINVRLTETLGEQVSKIEIKKNFMVFLQAVMMGQLKLEGKLDKTTLQIIKMALDLDPSMIEQKMDNVLPPIMTAKKSGTVMKSYIDMMNCLLEILFKLSRGITFFNQILPHIKLCLEGSNTEQFELKQAMKDCVEKGENCEKLKSKVITGFDVFPLECVDLYGKFTSELMFRQNKELLLSLQKDFEENCLMMLEEGFVSPSIITIAEVLTSILSRFLHYNKMADHTVPQHVAEGFWTCYQNFEQECLKKFGECVLKLHYNPPLVLSFLKLCLSFSHVKLLNIKYGNTKMETPDIDGTSEVFDLNNLLPCLSGKQWITLASKIEDYEATLVLDNLLLVKTTLIELFTIKNPDPTKTDTTKTHIIKEMQKYPAIIDNNLPKLLFNHLDTTQIKQLSKCLIKIFLNDPEHNIFQTNAINSNRLLLNALTIETLKYVTKLYDNTEQLTKALNKSDFDITLYAREVNLKEILDKATTNIENQDNLQNYIEFLNSLQIYYLEEKYQLATIFVLLLVKKNCPTKKLRRNIDNLLLNLFELSSKIPDIYKILSVNNIFSFEDRTIMDLLTLKIKNVTNFIIKNILESAVNKVKSDGEVIKDLVDLIVTNKKRKDNSSVDLFSDPKFQMSCMILPIITKKKKNFTGAAYRSMLVNLQDKLHKKILESFKNIDFSSNCGLFASNTENVEDSMVVSEDMMATLNAVGAYSLILSKYCDSNDIEEIKNLNSLWSGLEYFIEHAIQSIQNSDSKPQHIESSVQLLNIVLRNTKKLESHKIFTDKDGLLLKVWKSITKRLLLVYEGEKCTCSEELAGALRFVCELCSIECFEKHFVSDLANYMDLKIPSIILKDELCTKTQMCSYKTSKYIWTQCLKANIIGAKCIALARLAYQKCRTTRVWVQENYDVTLGAGSSVKIEDEICDLLRTKLDVLSEIILAAKKIDLDYKFLDNIFEFQHVVHCIMGRNAKGISVEMPWTSFFNLFNGSIAVLNSLIVSREELLEDRWPNYMQCYRALLSLLCEKSTSPEQLDRQHEEKLAEIAHSIEKLTQTVCKRKHHIARIAAYTVADICFYLEKTAPSRAIRQHLENSVALLIQASDSTYAMAFLRRSLAGSAGQMTMTNLYSMYKRYHKYVGNS